MKIKASKNQSNGSKSVGEKKIMYLISRNKNGGRPHTPFFSLLILKLKTNCHFLKGQHYYNRLKFLVIIFKSRQILFKIMINFTILQSIHPSQSSFSNRGIKTQRNIKIRLPLQFCMNGLTYNYHWFNMASLVRKTGKKVANKRISRPFVKKCQ